MTAHRVCTKPTCAELNHVDAIVCHQCGTRLVPDRRTLERWMRVRGAIQHAADGIDPDLVADQIVASVEQRRVAVGEGAGRDTSETNGDSSLPRDLLSPRVAAGSNPPAAAPPIAGLA